MPATVLALQRHHCAMPGVKEGHLFPELFYGHIVALTPFWRVKCDFVSLIFGQRSLHIFANFPRITLPDGAGKSQITPRRVCLECLMVSEFRFAVDIV
jgi:hypothetical protein